MEILMPAIKSTCLLLALSAAALGQQEPTRPRSEVVCRHENEECILINRWYAEGTAAGNHGDHYDNRDHGHSSIKIQTYPQLRRVPYSEQERAKRVDIGAQTKIRQTVTIGNASTSAKVQTVGSNVRAQYYISDQGMKFLYTQYRLSNLYVYPEHRDYDAGHNGEHGYGDLFPTNSPYVVISRGSSFGDRPFVNAFIHTLAAFRPQVKSKLIQNGLLMPTLQVIFRMSNRHIRTKADYLSGRAHPTAFDAAHLGPVKMVKMAHAITLESIPPLVRLKVVEEDPPSNDYFKLTRPEKLSDTPAVIARIVRGPDYVRRIVVSAARSRDINEKPLTFHWVVLRGDEQKIQIDLRDGGAVAEIKVAYHPRRPIAKNSAMTSNRVDIGVFVQSTSVLSAPGFITFYSLDNELRTYGEGGHLLEIYYMATDLHRRVRNWTRIFEMLDETPNGFPAHVLQASMNGKQRRAILEIAQDYRPIHVQFIEANSILDRAKVYHKTAMKVLERSKKSLKNAKDQPAEVLELVRIEHAAALAAEKVTQQKLKGAQQIVDELRNQLGHILRRKATPLRGLSPQQFIEQRLEALVNDPQFYIRNATQIQTWVDASDDVVVREKWISARDELVKYEIFKELSPNNFVLQSVRPDNHPVEDRLLAFESHQIRRMQHILLTKLLMPDILTGRETKNFVDRRLTTPWPRRDVYHHDANGNVMGWTRYEGGSVSRSRESVISDR